MKGENWNTRAGAILAVAGSAVGLGNFLRFPGQVAQHGGGAFMIAYAVAFLAIGLPICWAEWTMGRKAGRLGFNSCPSILALLSRRPWMRFVGIAGIVVPVCIYMYYVLIEAWCLAYAVNYLLGNMHFETAAEAGAFFNQLVGAEAHGQALSFDLRHVGWFALFAFALNFVLIYRGLSRGIEWFCTYAMPALVILALIILVRVLTLGTPDVSQPDRNVANGLGFMWNPQKVVVETRQDNHWEATRRLHPWEDRTAIAASLNPQTERVRDIPLAEQLASPQLWLAAAGQIFFSLSVGFGVIITYASYLRQHDDVLLSGLTAASANQFCEVALGGLISLPAAVAYLGAAAMVGSLGTFALGFHTLPMVFAAMPFGSFFGFLFFILLFLAAVTSSLSMLQPGIAYLEESMQLRRSQSVAILGFITASGSTFVLYFSQNLTALDTLDFWTNTLMVVLATCQILLFSWVIGVEEGLREAHQGASIRLPRAFYPVFRYVTPTLLLAILATWCYTELLGYSFTQSGRTVSPRMAALFGEHADPVVWLSVGLLLLTALFILLTLPTARQLHPPPERP